MHPLPPNSINLHPAHFNLHAAHFSLHPALGRKIKCCPFWLKIGTPEILEVLIPNPELDFWNSDPKIHFWANMSQGCRRILRMLVLNPDLDFWNFDAKIHFWANLDPKSQNCLFCLKTGTHGISRILILIATLVFWISNPNFIFRQICMPTVCQH